MEKETCFESNRFLHENSIVGSLIDVYGNETKREVINSGVEYCPCPLWPVQPA